jgi:hypothetical protein
MHAHVEVDVDCGHERFWIVARAATVPWLPLQPVADAEQQWVAYPICRPRCLVIRGWGSVPPPSRCSCFWRRAGCIRPTRRALRWLPGGIAPERRDATLQAVTQPLTAEAHGLTP